MTKQSRFLLSNYILSISSAILLAFSFPPLDIGFLSFIALVPLLWVIKKSSSYREAFFFSYLCGMVFLFCNIYWIVYVSSFAMVLLVLYLALFFGLFGVVCKKVLCSGNKVLFPFLIASLWVCVEFLRLYIPILGFGWNFIGYSLYTFYPLIQIAQITGVWGVSFFIVMCNVIVYLLFSKNTLSLKIGLVVVGLLVATGIYGYGNMVLDSYNVQPEGKETTLKVGLVQGNISQDDKWYEENQDHIVAKYLSYSNQVSVEPEVDLVIWPETSFPQSVVSHDQPLLSRVFSFAKQKQMHMLIGAAVKEGGQYEHYNSALLISPNAQVIGRYDKVNLVPFGEYTPVNRSFPFLRYWSDYIGYFLPGTEYNLLVCNTFSLGVLICFEDMLPQVSRSYVKQGADVLVNMTNDAWFQKSCAAVQHLQNSVFRAVENQRYLVRAGNTGITAIIHPTGKILNQVKDTNGKSLCTEGFVVGNIKKNNVSTLYQKWGDWFIVVCALLLFVVMFTMRFVRKSS